LQQLCLNDCTLQQYWIFSADALVDLASDVNLVCLNHGLLLSQDVGWEHVSEDGTVGRIDIIAGSSVRAVGTSGDVVEETWRRRDILSVDLESFHLDSLLFKSL